MHLPLFLVVKLFPPTNGRVGMKMERTNCSGVKGRSPEDVADKEDGLCEDPR